MNFKPEREFIRWYLETAIEVAELPDTDGWADFLPVQSFIEGHEELAQKMADIVLEASDRMSLGWDGPTASALVWPDQDLDGQHREFLAHCREQMEKEGIPFPG